jgi:NitT/TauT family transport system substrate-binding protein
MMPRRLLPVLALGLLIACGPAPAAAPGPSSAATPAPPRAATAAPAASSPTAAPAASGAPPRQVVRVGHIGATISDAPIFIAEDRGYFEAEGIAVERTAFDSAARMIPALAAGQLDVGGGAVSAGLFNAVGRGVDLRVVADKGSMQAGDRWNSLVARKELLDSGALRDWPDLRGRPVGIPAKGTGNEIVFARGLATAGMTLDDVDLKELGLPDIGVSLANGALDVGLQPEPLLTLGLDRGTFGLWKGQGDVVPGQQFTVIMYAGDFAAQHTEAAERYATAYVRGLRDYYNAFVVRRDDADADALAEFIAGYARLPGADLVKRMYPVRFDPDGRVNAESIASDYQYYRDSGQTTAAVDLAKLVDQRFVDYAVARLGAYR